MGLYLYFGLYRILVYSLFGLDRFIQDSCLFTVRFRQVYTGFLFIHCSADRFIQDSCLFTVRFRQDSCLFTVWFIQDSCLFTVRLRQVYTGFLFIHCSVQTGLYRILVYHCSVQTGLYRILVYHCWVQTGLYRILVYSLFGLDRFIHDSCLYTVWFRQVYTGFLFIHCLVQTGFTVQREEILIV